MASSEEIGRAFFVGQDRSKGAPPPELCAPDYSAVINSNPPIDLAGHTGFGRMFYTAFPDLHHDITEVFGTNDRVVVRWILKGTNTAEFMGIPATGKPMSVPGTVVMHLENGKIKQVYGVFDQMTMLQQLGLVPLS